MANTQKPANTHKPAWHSNVLACYPALLARLRTVAGVKKVCEAKELAALGADKKQMPLDGAVYVILDGFTPTAHNNNRREQMLEIGFSVILTKRHYTPQPQLGNKSVGETITALAQALQGFDPADEQGRAFTATPFKQTKALPIRYEDGFAYFPLRFTCEVAVISSVSL